MEFGDDHLSTVGEVIDVIGVVAIVVGVVYAAVDAALRGLRRVSPIYTRFRRVLGRAILLGLELLVAADIIKTVAVTPTLDSVVVLAIIVLIRTFLSWSLELEISGRWPWQKRGAPVVEVADATRTRRGRRADAPALGRCRARGGRSFGHGMVADALILRRARRPGRCSRCGSGATGRRHRGPTPGTDEVRDAQRRRTSESAWVPGVRASAAERRARMTSRAPRGDDPR